MPAKISQAKRDAILSDIQSGTMGRNQIALKHDVSGAAVSGIARTAMGPGAFDRTRVERATIAAAADARALRQELELMFLAEARAALGKLHGPYLAFSFGGKDNTYAERQLTEPTDTAYRNYAVGAAVLFDKALAAARHDTASSDGVTEVAVWVRTRMGGGAPAETRHLIAGEVLP